MKPIPVLFVTYNRLEYSKKALESICRSPGLPIELMIWDNASTDSTTEWLADEIAWRTQPNCAGVTVKFNHRNVGLAPAMNYFFRKYKNESYVVKVDNDTVLPDNWLADLMEVMKQYEGINPPHMGAVSGTCVRPPGLTAADWYAGMPQRHFNDYCLYFNPACLGTGVLINMNLIRERGLLFEKFPRAPEAGPDDPCLISGWGAYIQEASAYTDWKFAMYSKVPVQLLNLKEDQVLSNDYPEYDAEVKKVRDEGNAWWESVGGIAGVREYVQEHGGLEPLVDGPTRRIRRTTPPQLLTGADNLELRSTEKFWADRVSTVGATASSFLTTPQARINEFTEKHIRILKQYACGKDVLDVCCGWGRMSHPISILAKSYIGTDFMPVLIEKAKESLPHLDFRVAEATKLSFQSEQFDIVVAIACLSSFAAIFDQVLRELKRVLRPGGCILFLEEDFARIDWKLENA